MSGHCQINSRLAHVIYLDVAYWALWLEWSGSVYTWFMHNLVNFEIADPRQQNSS
jgi:hypothetical protein